MTNYFFRSIIKLSENDFLAVQFNKEGEKLMDTTEFTTQFYEEVRRRNKAKFIAIATKDIEKEQAKEGGINIPAFLEAEDAYNQFKNANCFDEYGRLKPLPQA